MSTHSVAIMWQTNNPQKQTGDIDINA
jgi:hypothetical protein